MANMQTGLLNQFNTVGLGLLLAGLLFEGLTKPRTSKSMAANSSTSIDLTIISPNDEYL